MCSSQQCCRTQVELPAHGLLELDFCVSPELTSAWPTGAASGKEPIDEQTFVAFRNEVLGTRPMRAHTAQPAPLPRCFSLSMGALHLCVRACGLACAGSGHTLLTQYSAVRCQMRCGAVRCQMRALLQKLE